MIDDGLSFRLVPWRPALEQNLGQQLADTMTPGGLAPKDYVPKALQSGELEMSCHDPDDPANWPRNMFVWRSNLRGSSGKGHEYFLKHLLGTSNGVLGKDLGVEGREKPQEVAWHDKAPEGKLDLLVTLDFHMSTTCVYSDIVLPTATWYEKNDLNTSDMHPFGEGRGQQCRQLEDLCGLGDCRRVADDLGRLVRAQRQKLKILVVNQEQGVIAGLKEIIRAYLTWPWLLLE